MFRVPFAVGGVAAFAPDGWKVDVTPEGIVTFSIDPDAPPPPSPGEVSFGDEVVSTAWRECPVPPAAMDEGPRNRAERRAAARAARKAGAR